MANPEKKATGNDVIANATELTFDVFNHLTKQREEIEKVTRESIERTGALVKAGFQASLDAFDMGAKTMAAWQRIGEDAVRTFYGVAQRTMPNSR